jgi:DNA-binding MarR family transcriptional regulator
MAEKTDLQKVLRRWSEVFFQLTMRDFRAFMSASGLSHSQVNTLMRLRFRGPFTVSDIGDNLGVSPPAASQLIDKLVQTGLVERAEDPENRRAKQIRITAKGTTLVEKGIDARQEWVRKLTGSLAKDDQETVQRAMSILLQAAEKTEIIPPGGYEHARSPRG